jgi:hypothetical protein
MTGHLFASESVNLGEAGTGYPIPQINFNIKNQSLTETIIAAE